ncbi:phosphoadenosine phosphosulfate reductase [Sulfitobacter aestuariivivens]|uniref:Phosphoadenosine phosphosulfate reductase n=1 Tax=Sulfitobacter aestuariivivens TaxID=2766981 RepID=A0A927D5A5_9RHOB|nr:phosphoadenosine phosphosulfate reductase [Sulfitobacter aestuariivivens]MBD3663507.1 phosphoadenosine phosphosulfate reductase [Sulfitobacter aestuariivivens]
MTDQTPSLETSLAELSKPDWIHAVSQIVEEDGYFQQLGARHFASFVEEGTTLLVTFETIQGMHALSAMAQPFGWEMLRDYGWSHLCVASDGDTWFRDPDVYAYFDRLVDDGFFDEFEKVIFYGAGPCGYAAGAFSVASPLAQVVLIQPQATLDPRIADWDDRFVDMRRTDFSSRYGYAPDMLDAADQAFVLYDPRETLDAMHAALFTRQNVIKLRMTHMGAALQTDLMEMDQLAPLLLAVEAGTLTPASFAALYRARRDYRPYLRNVLMRLETLDRPLLAAALCRNVTSRIQRTGGFARRLRDLEARLAEEG